MSSSEKWPGRLALMVAHCAGMVDLVALPVWVGALMGYYRFDPQHAGGLVTLFLAGAVAASLFFSARFNRYPVRLMVSGAFALASLLFLTLSTVSDYATMAVLHLGAGLAAGCGLSFTHGTIGRSARPHFLFAMVGIALGVFAVVFLGATPKLVDQLGGEALFVAFGGVMAVAAVSSLVAFPRPEPNESVDGERAQQTPLSWSVKFCVVGVTLMSLVQAMTFSFVERMGSDRGFSVEAITGVFIALGLFNLVPPALAAALEKRLVAGWVLMLGPIVQACIALLITLSVQFVPFAAGAILFTAVMIFTHTFAFGTLARLDPTGRATAATPAMLMVGSAIGPLLGGTLVKFFGYTSLGIAAALLGMIAVGLFRQVRAQPVPA